MNAFSFLLKGPFEAKSYSVYKGESRKYALGSDSGTIHSEV